MRTGKVELIYAKSSTSIPGIGFSRKPWEGSQWLKSNSWAILSKDEDGIIFLPCPEGRDCSPVTRAASDAAGAPATTPSGM